ncbi:MAG: hypothetical protein L3J22_00580 [Xanthomonadales bacterium]|nr:hypothetical protein [Xanthomonadales bacterium]
MSKLKVYLLFALILVFILGVISQRNVLACEFVEYLDYSEIAPNIFASSSFDSAQNKNILSVINLGKSRVDNAFGDTISSPIVIIAATEDDASTFGSNAYGSAILTPFGQCIIFGPKGQNIDVIAHEYTHAEVSFRLGWLTHYFNMPIWFNEGIALLVDYREPYLLDNIDISPDEINTVKEMGADFFSGKDVLKNYQAARLAVESIDKSQLYDNLEKIKQGETINDVFALKN